MNPIKKYLKPIGTVLWEKWVEFKFDWVKITTSGMISPLLYMIALGWGLGSTKSVSDRPYIDFLIPGMSEQAHVDDDIPLRFRRINRKR